MRREAQQEIPTHIVTKVVAIVCDLCGAEKPAGSNEVTGRWLESFDGDTDTAFVSEEVVVRYKSGKAYPETGWGVECNLDICPACWREAVWPFLKSFNQSLKYTEYDW